MTQLKLNLIFHSEVDEISTEDLEAAADKYSSIKERIYEKAKTAKIPTMGGFKEPKIDNSKIIASLRKSAQSQLNKAEKINTEVSGNWTRRRQSFADNARRKKDNLIKNATALNRLADLWEVNKCPYILRKVKSVGDFDAYYPRDIDPDDGWFKDEHPKILAKAQKLGLTSQADNEPFKNAIKELLEIILSPEEIQERELQKKLIEIRGLKFPGFFPTPDDVIDEMFEYANIFEKKGLTVLEPSAGIGNICDKIKALDYEHKIDCVEVSPTLCEILKFKGYNYSCKDILKTTQVSGDLWDRIIMNPPFEKGQDVIHVKHCYNTYLKQGGVLVSIMSASVQSNTKKLYSEFRDFVSEKGGYFVKLGQRFNKANAFNNTGVSTIMVILNK
jgi:hypothetical protein